MFDWGVSNARYAYFIEMKIDGEWLRISENYTSYMEAWYAMWNFSAHDYPWSFFIIHTIKFN